MTVPVVDQTIGPIADLLRTCFEEALGREVCLRSGATTDLWVSTTYDECCAGVAWVRVANVFPGFPVEDQTPTNCFPPQWSVVLELGAARCAPTPAAEDIPTCDQHTALATDTFDDMAAMLCALICFTQADTEGREYQVGAWTPAPIEGRCGGGSMTVTVSFSPCLNCPAVG